MLSAQMPLLTILKMTLSSMHRQTKTSPTTEIKRCGPWPQSAAEKPLCGLAELPFDSLIASVPGRSEVDGIATVIAASAAKALMHSGSDAYQIRS